MHPDTINHTAPTPRSLLVGCVFGLIIGVPIGAVGLLLVAFFTGSLLSVGFGLLGLVYIPVIGALGGGLVGGIVGACLMPNRTRNDPT